MLFQREQSPATSYSDARSVARLTIGIGNFTRFAGLIIGALMINGGLAAGPVVLLVIPPPLRLNYLAAVAGGAAIIVVGGACLALASLFVGTLTMALGHVLAAGIDTASYATTVSRNDDRSRQPEDDACRSTPVGGSRDRSDMAVVLDH
jgi:hypothetical protein